MATANKPTTIPRVPIQTPMWEDPQGNNPWPWNLNRTWIIFFERIWKGNSSNNKNSVAGPWQRTLLLKDLTPGPSIADLTTIWVDGTALRLTGLLKKVITADLVIQVYKLDINNVGPGFQLLIEATIPLGHPIQEPKDFTSFSSIALAALHDGDVIRWDVISSDSQMDGKGVASFTLEWQ